MTGPIRVRGIDGLTLGQLTDELKRGGRFVRFPYTLSAIAITFRRQSGIYFIRAGEGTARRRWRYAIVSALLGWWAIPWGPAQTLSSLRANFRGGMDVTHGIIKLLFDAARPADTSSGEHGSAVGRTNHGSMPLPWEGARSPAA